MQGVRGMQALQGMFNPVPQKFGSRKKICTGWFIRFGSFIALHNFPCYVPFALKQLVD